MANLSDIEAVDLRGQQLDTLDPGARAKQLAARRKRLTAELVASGQLQAPQGRMIGSGPGAQYVNPSWADQLVKPAAQLMAGYQSGQLEQAETENERAANADLQTQLAALGAVPPGGDRRGIIAKLMTNPLAGTIGPDLLKDELLVAPEREAQRIERGEQAAADRVAKAEEAERVRVERGEQAAADRVARAELLNQRMTTPNVNVHVRAPGGAAPAKAPSGYRWTDEGELAPIPGGPADPSTKPAKPVNLSAAQQKAYDDSEALLGHIDNALESIKLNPNALGKKTLVPDIALATIDPEGVQTRAAVAGLAAEKVHQLSGAAVSPAEFARLRPYLPASGDSAKVAESKLTNLRAEVERIKAIHARGPTRAGGATGGWGDAPAPVKVRSVAEAQRLAPGTVFVDPSGVTRTR